MCSHQEIDFHPQVVSDVHWVTRPRGVHRNCTKMLERGEACRLQDRACLRYHIDFLRLSIWLIRSDAASVAQSGKE